MPTITKKDIESIVEKRLDRKVEYVGVIVNDEYVRTRPKKFGFWEITVEGDMAGFLIITEKDIAMLLEEKAESEKEKEFKQDKLI